MQDTEWAQHRLKLILALLLPSALGFISDETALLPSLLSTTPGSPASLSLLPRAANPMIYNVKNDSLHDSRC